MSRPSNELPWDMIRRRATAVSHSCSNSNYNRGVGWEEVPATLVADWSAELANWSTATAVTANRRYTILNNSSVNSNSSGNNSKANLGVWGMTKTGVEGAEGWRGRTQRRTTLFTSRDGWDSSVGWL